MNTTDFGVAGYVLLNTLNYQEQRICGSCTCMSYQTQQFPPNHVITEVILTGEDFDHTIYCDWCDCVLPVRYVESEDEDDLA